MHFDNLDDFWSHSTEIQIDPLKTSNVGYLFPNNYILL